MKNLAYSFFFLFWIFACTSNKLNQESSLTVVDEMRLKKENFTTVEVDSSIKYFKAKEGDKVKINFQLKNTGDSPLLISTCKTSIGCFVSTWSHEPIAPGDSTTIHTVYDTKGRLGETGFKTLTVSANIRPEILVLRVHGTIE